MRTHEEPKGKKKGRGRIEPTLATWSKYVVYLIKVLGVRHYMCLVFWVIITAVEMRAANVSLSPRLMSIVRLSTWKK
jgi:hypothetical protein